MRRFLAWLGIALAVGGFVLLALSIWLNVHFLIPVGMIAVAFACLFFAKRMSSDLPDKKEGEGEEKSDE